MTLGVARPLPGVRFEHRPPPSPRVLPRMDVAAFVGIAAGGPFHTPVAVEDPVEFAATFGGDVEIALDEERGEAEVGQLGAAVRAFVRNGGSRCWAVRVGDAGVAETARLPVPGLLARAADGSIEPASLPARSAGTWADGVTVGAALASSAAEIVAAHDTTFDLRFPGARSPAPGELLRVTGSGWSVVGPLVPAAPGSAPAAPGSARATLDRERAIWIEPAAAADVPAGGVTVEGEPPQPGSMLRVRAAGARTLWMAVDEVRAASEVSSPPGPPRFSVLGEAWWLAAALPPGPLPFGPEDTAELLSLELWARRPGAPPARLADLGFAPEHPRWAGMLPDDDALHGSPRAGAPAPPQLWADAVVAGFPLAGTGLDAGAVLFPLGMAVVPDRFLGAPASATDPLTRNGVPALAADLFLDPALMAARLEAVDEAADFVRYQSSAARPLRGIHAAMALDEVTLLAVPDAVLRRWTTEETEPLPPPVPPARRPADDALFVACATRNLPVPVLVASRPDEAGRSTLDWGPPDPGGARYELEGSADPAFGDAVTLYDGPGTTLAVNARESGPYYRVRAHAAGLEGEWSNGVAVDARPPVRTRLAADYDADVLVAVHRAALRLCGARGDMLAVLSLPGHYRDADSLAHSAALRPAARPLPEPAAVVPPLDLSEASALDHGALYHPWLVTLVDGGPALLRVPPDGAVAGTLAARARTRGAWVAPAGEALADAVALDPPPDPALAGAQQEARVNPIRQGPEGFACVSESTLGFDEDTRPIHVRRLLDLLRRLALLHGPDYVFEPNDDRLRRRIQRGFEAILRDLFKLGAFRGATAEEAFQVVTGTPPNTRQSSEAGRLIVELRVAPSQALRFITVRLVQGSAGGVAVEEA